MRFYPVDLAGHIVSHIQLASDGTFQGARAEQVSRLAVEFPTEPALVERFARKLRCLIENLKGEAVLECIAP